ncbi:hypothetical protein ABZZ17_29535 [Streptomyces sp. NPDC006512]|uniref:hypothetical protein n=1 Tax=Streptomyces sp. NPDC006512 TaxID=3154307 RepID=UPI0033BA49D9
MRIGPRAREPLAGVLLLVCAACVAVKATSGIDGGPALTMGAGENHGLLLGWLALGALAGAVRLGLRAKGRLRAGLLLVLGVAAALFLCATPPLLMLGGGGEETRRSAAPGRDDRVLVVEEGSAMIDPLWYVYVHQGDWPFERRWSVGYFNGDTGEHELRDVRWTGPGLIRMTTADGGVHEVAVAPDGRPDRVVSPG